jgi:putative membrane protein
MTTSAATAQGVTLSDHLAAERTLLAWIRTGLALMGFGFVVARFGLFLQQVQIAQRASSAQPYGPSLWFGTALIGAGVVLNLFSGWHHFRLIRTMGQGHATRPHTTTLAVLTSMFLALVGIGMAIYLISVRDSVHSHFANSEESFMASTVSNGILNKRSKYSVDETLERLKQTLQRKGITIFAIVDHSAKPKR